LESMNLLRGIFIRSVFILLAGIAFLNMSFILAEINALDLAKKYKSLVQMVINAGLEEEKEAGGEASETDSIEVDLIDGLLTHYEILLTSAKRRNKTLDRLALHPGHNETFSPPPDGISIPC
jgi:hypothetical protein